MVDTRADESRFRRETRSGFPILLSHVQDVTQRLVPIDRVHASTD